MELRLFNKLQFLGEDKIPLHNLIYTSAEEIAYNLPDFDKAYAYRFV